MLETIAATAAKPDERRPRTLDRAERSLAHVIAARERAYQAAAWAMLVIGGVALFIAPILLAGLVVGLETRLRANWHLMYWPSVAVASVAIIPLLFWMEIRTRGQWFEHELRGGSGVTIADALFARGAAGSTAGAAAIVEVLLWAPRMVLSARQRWNTPVGAATLHDAAAAIGFLRHFDSGVAVEELPTVQPLRVLCYLVSRDWVGVSPRGDRLWLLSDAKRFIGAPAR